MMLIQSTKQTYLAPSAKARHAAPKIRFSSIPKDSVLTTSHQVNLLSDPAEIPALVDFIRTHVGTQGGNESKEMLNLLYGLFLETGFANIYVVRDPKNNKRILGTTTLDNTNGLIYNACVDPDHRRKKIASHIFKALLTDAKSKRLPSVFLYTSNPDAIKLYEAQGFQMTNKHNELGEPQMVLKLNSNRAGQFFRTLWQKMKTIWPLSLADPSVSAKPSHI